MKIPSFIYVYSVHCQSTTWLHNNEGPHEKCTATVYDELSISSETASSSTPWLRGLMHGLASFARVGDLKGRHG
eukprot:6194391-Pleurochrysis_carterae.AAC.6